MNPLGMRKVHSFLAPLFGNCWGDRVAFRDKKRAENEIQGTLNMKINRQARIPCVAGILMAAIELKVLPLIIDTNIAMIQTML